MSARAAPVPHMPARNTRAVGSDQRAYVRRRGAFTSIGNPPFLGCAESLSQHDEAARRAPRPGSSRRAACYSPVPVHREAFARLLSHALPIAVALAISLLACHREAPVSADLVARIAGEPVPYSRFEEFLRKQA